MFTQYTPIYAHLPLLSLLLPCRLSLFFFFFFFFNATATTEIYTLSLHDALPISSTASAKKNVSPSPTRPSSVCTSTSTRLGDRKSTRLNSSHLGISYAVFCLKKKKK